MKATLSCAAVLLFAAFANCVPVTKLDAANAAASDSGSDSSTTPTVNNIFTTIVVTSEQIPLPNGSFVQETCNTTTVIDTITLDSVITSLCVPASDAVSTNASNSSSDGSNTQGLGVTTVSTGTATPDEVAAALASQNSANPSSSDHQSSDSFNQGVGAAIVGHGSVPANQVGQSTTGSQPPTVKRRAIVTMTSNVSTAEGSVVENCRIQLTPGATGQFTEEQSCELSLQPISDVNGGDTGTAPSPVAVTPSNTPDVVSSSSSSSSGSGSSSAPQAPTPTPTPPALAPSASPATSSVPVPLSPSPVADSSPDSAGAIIMGTSITSMDLPSVSPTASVISAAEDNTTSAFTMPGRQISILPVGLAVFAGVSVIALIVVGAVTYERTKYRKNFRDRKLAEQQKAKADMMSERYMV